MIGMVGFFGSGTEALGKRGLFLGFLPPPGQDFLCALATWRPGVKNTEIDMRKKFLAILVFGAFVLGLGWIGAQTVGTRRVTSGMPSDANGYEIECYTGSQSDSYTLVAATDSGTNLQFSQQVFKVILYNAGPNLLYVDFDAVASTADFPIPSGASLTVPRQCRTVHAYSAGAPTLYVLGLY